MTPFEEIFCTYNGVTHVGPRPGLAFPNRPIVGDLTQFMNADPLNPCNCAGFFAPNTPAVPANCAMSPHEKTIMLNADMVQNFPITAQSGTNNVLDTPALDIGTGVDAELCGVAVTHAFSQIAPRPPRFNSNEAVNNLRLVFPETVVGNRRQGFGCVTNTIGDVPSLGIAYAELNQQQMHSSLLPKDPTNTAVSLWATVQSFLSRSLGGCLEGISTFNGHFAPYGGSIKHPSSLGSYIGDNTVPVCTDPTPLFGNGKDNFYREFEIAFTKMTTVGYTYAHTFNPPSVTTFTDSRGLALVPPLPSVVNSAINGISVFINPATGTPQNINMVASGDGKLGSLSDIDLGSSSCKTTFPIQCYPGLPTVAPTKAPTSLPSTKPTKAPLSKKPTKAPVTKRPTKAPI